MCSKMVATFILVQGSRSKRGRALSKGTLHTGSKYSLRPRRHGSSNPEADCFWEKGSPPSGQNLSQAIDLLSREGS